MRWLPALLCMAVIFWFSSMPGNEVARVTGPLVAHAPPKVAAAKIDWLKVGHFIGYAGLGLALAYAFRPRAAQPLLQALLSAAVYALTDELHQIFVPGRHFLITDILLDTVAAGLGALLLYSIWRRQKRIRGQ